MNEERLFRGKYRVGSSRLKGFDYSMNGAYFITICTKNRMPFFGEIENEKMKLNALGEQADYYWRQIPQHFSMVKLDFFVVMPDHIHGIIFIDDSLAGTERQNIGVETQDFASLRKGYYKNKFGPQSKNLSSIIRGFKIGMTKYANRHNIHFSWQNRFHDRIIRSKKELNNIRHYIELNPMNWE